jgi:hypothetical protein
MTACHFVQGFAAPGLMAPGFFSSGLSTSPDYARRAPPNIAGPRFCD